MEGTSLSLYLWGQREERQMESSFVRFFFFFFNDTATTEIYTLSLHDALPILSRWLASFSAAPPPCATGRCARRSEEHTSELQSQSNLVCRLLLEKKQSAPSPLRTAVEPSPPRRRRRLRRRPTPRRTRTPSPDR